MKRGRNWISPRFFVCLQFSRSHTPSPSLTLSLFLPPTLSLAFSLSLFACASLANYICAANLGLWPTVHSAAIAVPTVPTTPRSCPTPLRVIRAYIMVTVANCEWQRNGWMTKAMAAAEAGKKQGERVETEHENKFIKAFIKFDTCCHISCYILWHGTCLIRL